jgi:transcription elongation factor GreA
MSNENKNLLTKEGYEKLKSELEHLRNTKRVDVAAKIKEAREMGDILENTVYDAAVEEQDYIEARIKELEDILGNSKILAPSDLKHDFVQLGHTVTIECEGRKDQFTIVGSEEADPLSKMISHESPVGKALLGTKIGDTVEVKTPVFKAVYKIIEIK